MAQLDVHGGRQRRDGRAGTSDNTHCLSFCNHCFFCTRSLSGHCSAAAAEGRTLHAPFCGECVCSNAAQLDLQGSIFFGCNSFFLSLIISFFCCS